jgi:hypothetical protein
MDQVHSHCCRKHGHQQVEKRDQHANGANEPKQEARQFLDAALRCAMAGNQHVFQILAQKERIDEHESDRRANARH